MAKGMGHQNVSPRKLAIGMKVVVWIKPGTYLFEHELAYAHGTGKWFKATLTSVFGGACQLENAGKVSVFSNGVAIIIRSTALEDNLTQGKIAQRLRAAAKRQRKEIVGSVKIVRSEIK